MVEVLVHKLMVPQKRHHAAAIRCRVRAPPFQRRRCAARAEEAPAAGSSREQSARAQRGGSLACVAIRCGTAVEAFRSRQMPVLGQSGREGSQVEAVGQPVLRRQERESQALPPARRRPPARLQRSARILLLPRKNRQQRRETARKSCQ